MAIVKVHFYRVYDHRTGDMLVQPAMRTEASIAELKGQILADCFEVISTSQLVGEVYPGPEIRAALVGLDNGEVKPVYAIDYEGGIWLVPAWLVDTSTGVASPERMIRAGSSAQVQRLSPGQKFDYANILLPKAVLEGLTEESSGLEVRSLPSSPKIHKSFLKPLPTVF